MIEQFAPQNVTRFVQPTMSPIVDPCPFPNHRVYTCQLDWAGGGERGGIPFSYWFASLLGLGVCEQTLRARTLLPSTKNDPLFRHLICNGLPSTYFRTTHQRHDTCSLMTMALPITFTNFELRHPCISLYPRPWRPLPPPAGVTSLSAPFRRKTPHSRRHLIFSRPMWVNAISSTS